MYKRKAINSRTGDRLLDRLFFIRFFFLDGEKRKGKGVSSKKYVDVNAKNDDNDTDDVESRLYTKEFPPFLLVSYVSFLLSAWIGRSSRVGSGQDQEG